MQISQCVVTHSTLTNCCDLNSFAAVDCIGRKRETQSFLGRLHVGVGQIQ